MPKLYKLKTISDHRGDLTVLEEELHYPVKRLFFLHNIAPGETRGGHGHIKTLMTILCLSGSCDIYVNNGEIKKTFHLDSPSMALYMDPQDWHLIKNATPDAMIAVLASETYDKKDYFFTEPA
ncbi:MAG: sugar 3,4-ketoisomerase [Bacteriovorax sp.]